MNRKHLSIDAAAYAFGGAFFILVIGLVVSGIYLLIGMIGMLP